uniref:Vacuolar protein sorting-associated protein 54 n=1 Tax=Gouania willdenowi TaxID=441366 RepID=A0A8C5HV01_GOUWI
MNERQFKLFISYIILTFPFQQLVSKVASPYAMASSHSSQAKFHSGSRGTDALYNKEQNPTPLCFLAPRSLPDVCPKEPTGEGLALCSGPSVVAEHELWTVYSSKVNLPAALNDPRLAKRESDFFTKSWGLDFTETDVMPAFYLPNINRDHFVTYLQEMAQKEQIHQRCKKICPNKDSKDTVSSVTSNNVFVCVDLLQIFFKPDFALEDPATFNTVLPWSHFNSTGGRKTRDWASSKLLQEKLSHYLDVVEVNIAQQISLRSEAFFHAMSSQHELQDQLRETQWAVSVLRRGTTAIDRVMCQGPLQALCTTLTRNNCVKLHNKLKLMATVHQTQPTVQLLLSTSEFVGALELISTTKEVLQQELQGITSFRHLGSQLCELEKLIDKMMEEDFSIYVRSDFSSSLKDEPHVLEKERLESLVFGLLRQKKLDFLCIYSDEMIVAAKALVTQWFELLKKILENFLLFLQKIKATLNVIRNVVLKVLYSNQKNLVLDKYVAGLSVQETSVDPVLQGEAELAYLTHEGLFISDALSEAQQQDQSSNSKPKQSSLIIVFADEQCVYGVNVVPTELELNGVISNIQELLHTASDVSHDLLVRWVLQSQANRFVHRFHEERKNKLSLLLDNERWKQAEVPTEFQDLVNSIVDGQITLPERKTIGNSPDNRKPTEYLLVNGERYAVVGTVLLLIRIFLEYCQCVNDVPSIATDMLTRLSDLLKHFNSRSCQLVLGAGALQVLGLKTITTKNLALASRCLQLVVYYIPVIRAHFESKLHPKQCSVLRHLDHIKKDYNDHIAEISAKLIAIMDSVFEKALSKYEMKAPMPSSCLRNVCKQMAKMHEAINELLPEQQTQMLFLRINTTFKMHMKSQLARLGVINDGGPQHGLVVVDMAFYTDNIHALKNLELLDLNMAEIWEQKR